MRSEESRLLSDCAAAVDGSAMPAMHVRAAALARYVNTTCLLNGRKSSKLGSAFERGTEVPPESGATTEPYPDAEFRPFSTAQLGMKSIRAGAFCLSTAALWGTFPGSGPATLLYGTPRR